MQSLVSILWTSYIVPLVALETAKSKSFLNEKHHSRCNSHYFLNIFNILCHNDKRLLGVGSTFSSVVSLG